MKLLVTLLIALVLLTVCAKAQIQDDREAVKQAVLDYVEALYEADASRIERSVHPEQTGIRAR